MWQLIVGGMLLVGCVALISGCRHYDCMTDEERREAGLWVNEGVE